MLLIKMNKSEQRKKCVLNMFKLNFQFLCVYFEVLWVCIFLNKLPIFCMTFNTVHSPWSYLPLSKLLNLKRCHDLFDLLIRLEVFFHQLNLQLQSLNFIQKNWVFEYSSYLDTLFKAHFLIVSLLYPRKDWPKNVAFFA